MRTIRFYRTASGKCPVADCLNALSDIEATKTAWVLKLIREVDPVPSKYFKKLVNTKDIWEIKIDDGRNAFRLIGFSYGRELIVLTNCFQKKTRKTPMREINLAERRKQEYLDRR